MILFFNRKGKQWAKDFAALAFIAVFLFLFQIACGSNEAGTAVPSTATPKTPLTLPDGFSAEVVVSGLLRPTQFIWGTRRPSLGSPAF